MRRTFVGGLATSLVLLTLSASAGTIKVVNGVAIYTANNNEVNTLVVNPRGTVFLQESGETRTGFTVRDDTANLFLDGGNSGCIKSGITVLCDPGPASFEVDLRDKNDRIRVENDGADGGTPVPMKVKGGNGDDVLEGSAVGDRLDGEAGNDTIDGKGGTDVLIGGLGDDTLTGGPGVDNFNGGAGGDRMFAQDGNAEVVDCGVGVDTVVNADANDDQRQCRI